MGYAARANDTIEVNAIYHGFSGRMPPYRPLEILKKSEVSVDLEAPDWKCIPVLLPPDKVVLLLLPQKDEKRRLLRRGGQKSPWNSPQGPLMRRAAGG